MGVDPGTAIAGFGVVDGGAGGRARPSLVECGVIRTTARETLPERLRVVHEGIVELIQRHRPDVVAVEGIFYARNVRSTIVLGHARGVILLAAAAAGLPVAEYAPAMVKRTVVGRGAAAKAQVGYMVAQLLRLAQAPSPADAADAVAIALTHLLRGGRMVGPAGDR
ncbi:MAG TPA: crossover junction endodeoxyribonuclease RuvC [Gemmatimonadales bacterium]|nr:crossover junction endodeoxyribonuclease RuvC [Gemmatimonadales bacterium]